MVTWRDFTDQAVKVPFVDLGRSWRGWDCWGLVMQYYLCVKGADVADCGPYESTKNMRCLARLFRGRTVNWAQCDRETGAVATMFRRGLVVHAGIALPRGMVLHADPNCGTILQRESDVFANLKVEGYWVPV